MAVVPVPDVGRAKGEPIGSSRFTARWADLRAGASALADHELSAVVLTNLAGTGATFGLALLAFSLIMCIDSHE